jgi:signal transduction histidine kinase
VLPLIRRIADPASPNMVILAGVDLASFEEYYRTIRRGQGGSICLLRADGLLLARSPSPDESQRGQSLANDPAFKAGQTMGNDGFLTARSPIDGIERMTAFKRIAPYSVGVTASLSTAEVLAPWWHRFWLMSAGAALTTVAISIFTVLILRLLSRLEAEALGLELRVRDRTFALKQLLQRREQFLAEISHELRSPLNAIIGFTEALIHGIRGPVPPAQAEYLTDINRSGLHLLALVNDLLDNAAIDAGSLRLDESDFDLAEIVEETVRLVDRCAAARKISIVTSLSPPGLTLRGDRRRLLQALLNVSVNAVKYGREGGRVEIRAGREPDGDCLLTITDDGVGISPEDLRLALTPYGRVGRHETAGTDEGTGLGLPLSIGILELHGGTLTLHSTPGRGTRAELLLPAERVRVSDCPRAVGLV